MTPSEKGRIERRVTNSKKLLNYITSSEASDILARMKNEAAEFSADWKALDFSLQAIALIERMSDILSKVSGTEAA